MLQRYVSYFILQNDWTEKVDQSEPSPVFSKFNFVIVDNCYIHTLS